MNKIVFPRIEIILYYAKRHKLNGNYGSIKVHRVYPSVIVTVG